MRTFLTALATATIAAAGVWIFRDGSRQTPPPLPTPISVPVVQMPAPAKAASDNNGELEGRLEPGSEVEIRTSLIDYPVHLKANAGDLVQKGQLLVELGDSKLEESVNQAEAALNLVKTEFQQRQARLAQSEKEQSSPLAPGAKPVTSRHAGDTQKQAAAAEEELDRSRLQQAEAGVARAKLALAETRIVAPISGYVIQRQADGELSKPDVVLMRIVDISTVKAVLQVSPQMNSRVVADQEAHVTLNEMPGRTFLGKVLRKPSVRNLRVHDNSVSIEVANPEALLKPGMYARVRLMFDQNNEPRLASLTSWYGKVFPGGKGPDGKTVGPQSDAELLSNLKGLTQTMSTMATDLERREQAAKIMAEASRVHFLALEKLIVRLREDSSATHKLTWEKTADAIDNLPALHVDEELLTFSTDVSKALREMAERRRSVARETTSIDWTYWDRTDRATSAIKGQGLQRINCAMTEMRRKLTKKYNLEFLATAERTPSARHDNRRPKH
jgi:membrane fusion protein, multidrug efflux system